MLNKQKNSENEELILEAAKQVFINKGLAGARMQEIADKAGINKAMLHYYYRNKETLFKTVFVNTFGQAMKMLNGIFESDQPLFDKIYQFTDNYISFLQANPYVPVFIISETQRNPKFLSGLADEMELPRFNILLPQIEEEVKKGIIKPIQPLQLVLNLLSLCVFPVVAKNVLLSIGQVKEEQYSLLLESRKKEVADFVINSIKNEK